MTALAGITVDAPGARKTGSISSATNTLERRKRMEFPETYRIIKDKKHEYNLHKIRVYLRKAYKKARHKRSASRFPYEEWI